MLRQYEMLSQYVDKAFGLVDRAITAEVELTRALAAEGGVSENFIELRSMEMKESREALRDFGGALKELGLAAERAHERTLQHELELKKLELQHALELKKLKASVPPKTSQELEIELLKAKTAAQAEMPWDIREEAARKIFGIAPESDESDEFEAKCA